MKIAYAGIDLMYPALQALADQGHEIVKVFSCETDGVCETNTEVTRIARELGVPITCERITAEDLSELVLLGCEALVTAGYYYRMPIDDRLRMMNIHPALLPVGRGAWPMPLTILRGMRKSGVTIHKMAESFDTGDILMQREFELLEREDLMSFMDKVCALLPQMLRELFADLDRYYDGAIPQGEGEYWECPNESDYPITAETPVSEADLILRAFMGYECVYRTDNKTYALQFGRAVEGDGEGMELPLDGGYVLAEKIRIISEK
ncbi:MAG: hypothetical protein IJ386_00530 [Clostridia bacterium]|nr:hypothetical protein [Clostridia bacterium]